MHSGYCVLQVLTTAVRPLCHKVKGLFENRHSCFAILQRVVQGRWRESDHIRFPFVANYPILCEIFEHGSHHLRSNGKEQQRQLCSTLRSLARCDDRKSTPRVIQNLVRRNEVLRLFSVIFPELRSVQRNALLTAPSSLPF